MTRSLRYGDLPESDRTYEERQGPDGRKFILVGQPTILHCPRCDGQYSATRGDYFLQADRQIIVCGNCGHDDLRLVREERRLVAVGP